MRIKAKSKNGKTVVQALIKHPMMSFVQAKKAGKKANFITYISAKVGDQLVLDASPSQNLSKNPYIKFAFMGEAKGKEVEITWTDLSGATKTGKAKIK